MAAFPLTWLVLYMVYAVKAQEFILIDNALPRYLTAFCTAIWNDELMLFGGRYNMSYLSGDVINSHIYSLQLNFSNPRDGLYAQNWQSSPDPITQPAYYEAQACVQASFHDSLSPVLYTSPLFFYESAAQVARYNLSSHGQQYASYTLPSQSGVWTYSSFSSSCVIMHANLVYVLDAAYDEIPFLIFNSANQSWSEGPAMHAARYSMGCVSFANTSVFISDSDASANVSDPEIFVFGGSSVVNTKLASIERYALSDGSDDNLQWFEQSAALSEAREKTRCIVIGLEIFCCGGTNGAYSSTSAVDVFTVADNELNVHLFDVLLLKNTLYMHEPRTSAALQMINGNLYVLGGYSLQNEGNQVFKRTMFNSVEMLSMTSSPTAAPSVSPVLPPTNAPMHSPTVAPTLFPTWHPTLPTREPTQNVMIVKVHDAETVEPLSFTFYVVVMSMYAVGVGMLACLGRCHARGKTYTFEMLSLFTCLLYVLDVHADCFFAVNLLFAYRDSKDKTLLALSFASVMFLFLSRLVSLRELERFIAKCIGEQEDEESMDYFGAHSCKLYGFAILTGKYVQNPHAFTIYKTGTRLVPRVVNLQNQLPRHAAALQLQSVRRRPFRAFHRQARGDGAAEPRDGRRLPVPGPATARGVDRVRGAHEKVRHRRCAVHYRLWRRIHRRVGAVVEDEATHPCHRLWSHTEWIRVDGCE